MSFKTALYVALISLTAVFYVSAIVTNVATMLGKTITLWDVCDAGICSGQYASTCNTGNQVLDADRATSVLACVFVGIALFAGVFDYIAPNKLYKYCNSVVAAFALVFGTISFSLGFALYASTLCTAAASLQTAGYDVGPHPILFVVGVAFNAAAIAADCCGPETDADKLEREEKKKKAKRLGMAPPPAVIPKSVSAAGNISSRSGSVVFNSSNIFPRQVQQSMITSAGIPRMTSPPRPPTSPPRSPTQYQQQRQLNEPTSTTAGVSSSRSLDRPEVVRSASVIIQQQEPPRFRPPPPPQQQQQQLFSQPADGDWILDESSGLYWSDEQQLWFDDTTGFFIDPVTGQSYDPRIGEWSG